MNCIHSKKLVGKNSMIYSLFNFCPRSAQSRRHGMALVGLVPPNKAQSPQAETWNTINQLRFCQFLECQVPPHKPKAPVLKTF